MPSLYPPEIVHNHFTDPVVLPDVAPPKLIRGLRSAYSLLPVNTVKQRVVELRGIKLQVPVTGVATRKSFDNNPGANVRSNARDKRLHFAPNIETIELHWDLGGARQVTALAFEVYKVNTPAPLYRATMTFGVGTCPPAGLFSWNGRLDQALVCAGAAVVCTPAYLAAEFPDDALCVDQGPYKFKLVVLDPGATLVRITPARWVYADVLLGRPTLDWLPRNTLAASPALPTNGLAPVERDHQVYDALTDANDADNLSGAVPAPGQSKRVYLESHAFYSAEAELTENMAWRQMRTVWGEGPNIPLRLTPAVRRSDDTLVTGAAALRALGAVKFAWEWLDAAPTPPGDLYQGIPPATADYHADGQAAAQAFVNGAADFDRGTTHPPGRNCHVERGGKRGPGAPHVMPPQPGTAAFPFVVTAPAAGNWCAVSELVRAGGEVGCTGIVLQPSIQPGDGFRLRVGPVCAGLVVPNAAFAPFHTAMNDMPTTVTAESGAFVVWKTVEHTVYNSDPAGLQQADCDTLALRFSKFNIRICSQVLPITNYRAALQALYNAASPSAPLLEPVVVLALAGDAAHVDANVAAWFKPWATFKADLIAQYGSAALAAVWADAYNHPTRTFWRGSAGRRPFALPWPTNPIVFTDNLAGDGITASVTITGQHGALVGMSTQPAASVDVLAAAAKTAMGMVHQDTQSMYVGGDPALTAEVRCPNARRADATAALTAGIAAYTDGQCESAYEESAGYAWGFRVVDLVLRDWVGQDDGLITLQFARGSNFIGSPGGKAGFAPASRASINIFMLKTDEMLGTLCHEIGHAMFVNHQYYTAQGGVANDPRQLHDDAAPRHCTLNTPAAQRNFCGFCMLRLRAWSIYKLDGGRNLQARLPAPLATDPDQHVRTLSKLVADNTR